MAKNVQRVPLSVLIPTRNEEANLLNSLLPLKGWADQIVVVDSQSTDATCEVARRFGAEVVQFHYQGGWPKKRQWALDNIAWRNEWILLLDADEILTDALKEEVAHAIQSTTFCGYYIKLQPYFLGKRLKHGGFDFWKLSLFRRGMGRLEVRLEEPDHYVGDAEIHAHVTVAGPTGYLKNPIEHRNVSSLFRFIEKHNQYSTLEAARTHAERTGNWSVTDDELAPRLFGGNQAQRRRWLKKRLFHLPGYSVLRFLYSYVARLGFLDGTPGLIYCVFKAIQNFHTKAKLKELELAEKKGKASHGKSLYPSDL